VCVIYFAGFDVPQPVLHWWTCEQLVRFDSGTQSVGQHIHDADQLHPTDDMLYKQCSQHKRGQPQLLCECGRV